MPENIGPVRRLWVMTLLGDAASVTSTYVCSDAEKRLSTCRAAATTSPRRRLSPRRRRRRTRPARSTGLLADRDGDGRDPRVRVGVVCLGHAPVDDVVRRRRRRAEEESNDSKHLELAIDSTGSIDAGVFDATEQNAGKSTFLRRRALHACSRAFSINVNSRLSVKLPQMMALAVQTCGDAGISHNH